MMRPNLWVPRMRLCQTGGGSGPTKPGACSKHGERVDTGRTPLNRGDAPRLRPAALLVGDASAQ